MFFICTKWSPDVTPQHWLTSWKTIWEEKRGFYQEVVRSVNIDSLLMIWQTQIRSHRDGLQSTQATVWMTRTGDDWLQTRLGRHEDPSDLSVFVFSQVCSTHWKWSCHDCMTSLSVKLLVMLPDGPWITSMCQESSDTFRFKSFTCERKRWTAEYKTGVVYR